MAKMRTIMAIVLSCVADCTIDGAFDGKPPEVKRDLATLSFHLNPGKSVFALYEPMVLAYTLTNVSDIEVETVSDLNYYAGEVAVSIRRDEGEAVELKREGIAITYVPKAAVRLKPREMITGEVVVFYNHNARGLAFPVPGRYMLTGGVHVWNDPNPVVLWAKPVSIEVREPTGREREAIEALGSTDRLMLLFRMGLKYYCGEELAESCGEGVRSFLRRFGDSAYAPAVAYYYGRAVASGTPPVGSKGEEAADVFADILERWPGHPFAPIVMSALVLELHKTGRREGALRWLHRFEEEFPDRGYELRELRHRIE